MQGIINRLSKEVADKINESLKKRCEELGLEINKETGKRITIVSHESEPNHRYYWLDFESVNKLFLMQSDIVDNSDFKKRILSAPKLQISYEL